MPRGIVSWSAWASALAFFLTGLFPLFNADAYGHLAQGRQIAALGRVPKVDLFSFWRAEPQPWSNYEWAYDLVTWLMYDRLGANAVILFKCVALGLLGYLLVVLACRLARGLPLAAPLALAALLFALPVARFRFTTRPQIVGLLFPAVLLVGINSLYAEQSSSRKKAWIVVGLGLLHLVWVNAHGSHLLGSLITGIFLVFSLRTAAFRWMAALMALQLIATGCTPFGFSIVTDAASHVLRPEYRHVVIEWAPWSPRDPLRLLVAPIVASLLVLASLKPVTRSGRFGLAYGVFCLLLCAMAFRSMRFVAHQLLFTAPFVAAGLSQLPRVREMRSGAIVVVAIATLSCAFWTSRLLPSFGFGLGETKREYPWASAELIDRHLGSARILASLQDSWMLMFAVPDGRFLIDGRVPFYGPEFTQRVLGSFGDATVFEEELREYQVNTVAIDHTRSDHIPATDYLSGSPEWDLVFLEDGHSLFVLRGTAPTLEPLRIVGPGYRTGGVLQAGYTEEEIDFEIGRLGEHPTGGSIRAWLRGLQLVRPLARDGDRAGIRMYRHPDEQEQAREAYLLLTQAADRYPGFTSIELYRAMAALAACDVANAREALGRARYGGETRGTSLVAVELALRAGDESERSAAVTHMERLRAHRGSKNDPWVVAIAEEVDVRCP